MIPSPPTVVRCTDCDWKRLANGVARHLLYKLGLEHITATDGHPVMMDPPFEEWELPAPDPMLTRWEFQPCLAQRVIVRLPNRADCVDPRWYDASGEIRPAVVVLAATIFGPKRMILDDDHGVAWRKVTRERGAPTSPHRELPSNSVVLRAAT